MFLDRHYKYEDETDPNKGESMTGNKSQQVKAVPFEIEGCIEASERIWTLGQRR